MNRKHDHELSSSTRIQVTGIPYDISEQELDIDLMFQELVGLGNRPTIRSFEVCSDIALEQEVTVWVLIVVLIFICIFGSYLFWLKAN